jgi:hypothetical protein
MLEHDILGDVNRKRITLGLAGRNAQAAQAKKRFLERVRNAPDLGTGGVIRWSRDEIHCR